MDSLDPASPIAATIETASEPAPRVWKFWGTAFWGFVVFAAMFIGQLAVVGWFLFRQGGSIDQESFGEAVRIVVSNGLTISLSVITGLPAVLVALWIAIRIKGARFADYLALRWFAWTDLAIGVVALFVLVMGWDALSRATGREVEPGFMGDVLKTARDDGALWLLVFAFCVAAPITEEFFARGFLYRGWSESFLAPRGRHRPVVAGLDRAAPAIQLVLSRRSVLDRSVARLFALPQQLDLVDHHSARPE